MFFQLFNLFLLVTTYVHFFCIFILTSLYIMLLIWVHFKLDEAKFHSCSI